MGVRESELVFFPLPIPAPAEYWRTHRRVIHHYLHAGAASKLAEHQTRFNLRFLRALLDSPQEVFEHTRQCVSCRA